MNIIDKAVEYSSAAWALRALGACKERCSPTSAPSIAGRRKPVPALFGLGALAGDAVFNHLGFGAPWLAFFLALGFGFTVLTRLTALQILFSDAVMLGGMNARMLKNHLVFLIAQTNLLLFRQMLIGLMVAHAFFFVLGLAAGALRRFKLARNAACSRAFFSAAA